jgi:hypothetical protein
VAAPTATTQTRAPATCFDQALALSTYSFIPPDARLAASVRLDHPDLDRALSHLAALKAPHPLPIVVATTLSHLQTQVDLLRPLLARAGFDPTELLLLATRDGDMAWVWRTTCDLEIARKSVEQAWNVQVRQTAGALVGSPRAGDDFAFDVIFLPGELVVLAPAGKASRVRLWLDGPDTGQPPVGKKHTPGTRLDKVLSAAVRAVMTGTGLLPSEVAAGASAPKELRATSSGLEIDGTPWHPTQ